MVASDAYTSVVDAPPDRACDHGTRVPGLVGATNTGPPPSTLAPRQALRYYSGIAAEMGFRNATLNGLVTVTGFDQSGSLITETIRRGFKTLTP